MPVIYKQQLNVHSILTGQIFVFTNICMPPRVVAAVCYPLLFPNPNQPVGTIVELRLPELALPIPVAVLDVPDKL